MKPLSAWIVTLAVAMYATFAQSLDYLTLNWQTGAYATNKLVINSTPTTYATFTGHYSLYLAQLDQDGEWSFSPERGYTPFRSVSQGSHHTGVGSEGIVSGAFLIPAVASNSYLQFIMVLYEHSTGRYFHLSDTPGGPGIDPYEIGELNATWPPPFPEYYWPESSTGYFYKGAEIPAFCGWLAEHGLVEADLAGLSTNLVNQAFAVGANPTNFTDVALAFNSVSFGPSAITGTVSLVARDGAGAPLAVTSLKGSAALSLLSAATPGGAETALPATFNLDAASFQSATGATNAAQFLRLKLAVPEVW